MAKKIRNESKDLRQFGIVLGLVLITFGSVNFIKNRLTLSVLLMAPGVLSLALAFVAPLSLRGAYAVFVKIAHAIGWFNTKVILGLIYFFIVTPIGLFMRMFGKDPLNRSFDKRASTYWIDRKAVKADRTQLEKQF
jgi:hypothetical protein